MRSVAADRVAVAAGGRDEETYSKYAEGVRVKIDSELEAATAAFKDCVNIEKWVKFGEQRR